MNREEEIKLIAYDMYEKEGRVNGHDVEHWSKAEAIWEKRRRQRQILYLVAVALLLGLMLFFEWKLGTFRISYGIITGTIFILTMVFWFSEKRRKREIKIWRQIISFVIIALYFILVLDYERVSGTFQTSHVILLVIIGILTIIFSLSRGLRRLLIDFVGLEGEFTSSMVPKWEICLFGGVLISLYLLLSGKTNGIPPVLQFSIIPVTATLGGLVVAGANYSHIKQEQRSELLKVAQKLIVATIAFIFFAALFFLADDVNPNNLPATGLEAIRFVSFWFAAFLFYSGTMLFIPGIIDLAIGLKNLKKE
jgi:hypothetical protein